MSKSEQAYQHLRQSIISGAIAPDVALRIQTLGETTGFGSTPVREALRRLEAESLVLAENNRGFRSAPISVEEVKDLEASRLIVEQAMLRNSIKSGGDQWESQIVAAHYQLAKLDMPLDTPDKSQQLLWSKKHQQFHDALVGAAQSKWLCSFQRQLTEQLQRNYSFTINEALVDRVAASAKLQDSLRHSFGMEHHSQLMEATLDRDTAKAVTLLKEHTQFAVEFFTEVFA